MVTIVEASKCPICGDQGKLRRSNKVDGDDGQKWDLATYYCPNEEGCRWAKQGSGWLVQSDKEGNVWERSRGERGMDKTFEKRTISPDRLSFGRRVIEDIKQKDLRDDDGDGDDAA